MLGNDYAGDGVGCCNSGFLSEYKAFLSGLGTARPVTIEQGFNESLSTDGTTLGPSMTLNAGYSYHPTYEVIQRGRTTENIPVVFFEGAYENADTGFPSTPLDLRKQLGWSMTSGGAGTFYGNDSLWEFQSGWKGQLDTSDVAQRKAFNAAFAGINWQELQPDVDNRFVRVRPEQRVHRLVDQASTPAPTTRPMATMYPPPTRQTGRSVSSTILTPP